MDASPSTYTSVLVSSLMSALPSPQRILFCRKQKVERKNIPFWKTHQKVLAGAINEASNAEPACLTVVLASAVARDRVSDVFSGILRVGAGLALGRISQVADDGDAGNRARRGGAECASSSSCDGSGAAEQEGRHGWKYLESRLERRENRSLKE